MNTQSGFTMIELIVTVSVAAVLAAIAIPSFSDLIKDQRLTTEANGILASLVYARTEAIKRNRRVTICKSTNPTIANATCNTVANPGWNTGWITFVDGEPPAAPNGQREPATEVLLQAHGPVVGTLELSSADAVIQYNISYIPRGITQQIGGGAQSGTLKLCEPGNTIRGRSISISQTGRARVTTPATPFTTCP